MPTVDVRIVYPRHGSAVPIGRVYVFGTADPKDATVTGKVTARDGSAAINGTALPAGQVPPAYDWGLFFDGVHAKTLLRLDVTGTKATFTDGTATALIHARHAAFGPSILIDYPAPNGNVPGSFVAVGYVDPDSSQVTAWLQQSGQMQPAGQGQTVCLATQPPSPPPAPYDWSAQFSGIAAGNYILFVQATGGGGTTTLPINIVCTG
jgi:hypothetical protein